MNEKEILNLISKYLSSTCSLQEREKVKKWIEGDLLHERYFDAIKKIWDVAPEQEIEVNFEEECRRIGARLGIELSGADDSNQEKDNSISYDHLNNSKSSAYPIRTLLRVAAVIILIAIPVIYFVEFNSSSETFAYKNARMQEIQTSRGERAEMQFSDGSKIILNSMSSVRYPKTFRGGKREVYLKGEAFFKVVHNKKTPFTVHVNNVSIKDIGTEFNVNAFDEDKTVKVVVRKGKVAVKQNKLKGEQNGQANTSKKSGFEVVLSKGEITSVRLGMEPSLPKEVSLIPYLSWVNGQMVFEGVPMKGVISRLERAYDLTFEVQDSTILSKRLRGSFKKAPPQQILGVIAFSLDIDYELHGNTVILKSK